MTLENVKIVQEFAGTINRLNLEDIMVLIAPTFNVFIKLRDENEDTEDDVLQYHLSIRMNLSKKIKIELPKSTAPKSKLQNVPSKTQLSVPKVERRQRSEFIRKATEAEAKRFILLQMEFHIHATKNNLRDLQKYIDKYKHDIRFRMGYIFRTLEKWEREMVEFYTFEWKEKEKSWTSTALSVLTLGLVTPRNKTVHYHWVYYTHILRRNVDITYTIELLLELHYEQLEVAFKDYLMHKKSK